MDCGPTCLRMVAKYYGKHFSLNTLRSNSGFSKEGVSLLGISEAAEVIGYYYLIKNFIKANMAPNCVGRLVACKKMARCNYTCLWPRASSWVAKAC